MSTVRVTNVYDVTSLTTLYKFTLTSEDSSASIQTQMWPRNYFTDAYILTWILDLSVHTSVYTYTPLSLTNNLIYSFRMFSLKSIILIWHINTYTSKGSVVQMLYRCCIQLNDSDDLFTMTDLCVVCLDRFVIIWSQSVKLSQWESPHAQLCVCVGTTHSINHTCFMSMVNFRITN